MPLFVLIGRDGPDVLERRKTHRPSHLEYLGAFARADRVVFAGPLKDQSGQPRGSIYVFEAPDLAAAKSLVSSDPYVREGIFEIVDVFETMQVFPDKD